MRSFLFFCIGLLLPLAGEELSRNGSFEQLFKGWDYPHWERRPEPGRITTERVYGGKYAYDMGREGDAENYIYTSLPVSPGKSYLLRICLRTDGVPEKDAELRLLRFRPDSDGREKFRSAGYVERSPGGGETALIVTGGTRPWKEYEFYLDESRLPEGTSHVNLIISRKRNGSGVLGIDELSFREVPRREAPEKERSAAPNLWPGDSSFESASWPFRLPRDGRERCHGEYSLRVDPSVKEFGFHYLFGVMEPGRRYILSFYARAAEPCGLKVGVGNEFYRTVGNASFQLDREWKLCAVPLAVNSGRSLSANFSREAGAEIRLDAFSLTASDSAPEEFRPVPELVLGIPESDEPMEIYYTGPEPVNRTAVIRNNGNEEREIELSAGLETPFAPERKLLEKRRIVLAPGGRHEETLAVLPERRQGYYVIRLAAESGGKRIVSSIPFVVAAPPHPIEENSMFGLHNGEYDACRRIGMAWVRHYRNWSFWPMRDGKYDTSYDGPGFFNLNQPFRHYGIRHMETLFIADAPPRLKRAGTLHAPYEEMERFVDAMVEGTRGISRHYEIENEPHLVFPTVFKTGFLDAAKIYAEMTKKLSRRIRELNPDAQILGAGVGLRKDSDFEFIRTVLEIAGKDIDILAIHPYADARYINAEYSDIGPEDIRMYARTLTLRDMIRKMGFRQEIWYGEVGWALDVNEDYLSDGAMRHAAYLSRLMLLAKAAGVKKVFYFLGDHHIEKEKFYYGLWRVRRPLPAALAYAAGAQILEGSEPDGMISDSDLHIFTYRDRSGKLFAALWLSGNRRAKAIVDLPSGAIEVRNLFGQPVERKEGRLELEASGAPLYLFAGKVPEATFREALKRTGIDLPPVKIGWQLSSSKHISVTLKNLRSETLKGGFTLEGDGETESRNFSLAPENTESFAFEFASSSGSRVLKLAGTSTLGGFASEYRVELLSCPRLAAPPGTDAPLPEKGRLASMKDRTHLLPNDPNNGWDGPANLSVESVLGYDDDNLYLLADVRDDVQVQKHEPGNLWRDDALQLAIDTRADALPGVHGYGPDDYEFGFALGADGRPRKELTHVYELGRAAGILDEISFAAFRRGDVTGYRIAIPWKTLKMNPEKGNVFGLNFIVNDNDGPGSRFYMGLTPGIVEVKNPYAFRKFILE